MDSAVEELLSQARMLWVLLIGCLLRVAAVIGCIDVFGCCDWLHAVGGCCDWLH